MTVEKFEDLVAWQKSRVLTKRIYDLSKTGAFCKDRGLADQIRRAAGSTMHNVAEGFDAHTSPEFVRFLTYARRSAGEVQSQLYMALDQEYLSQVEFTDLYESAKEVKRIIGGLIRYLNSSSNTLREDGSSYQVTNQNDPTNDELSTDNL